MSDVPTLPCFKPQIRLLLKGEADPYPEFLPFADKDFIYTHVGTSEKDFLQDPVKNKAWKKGEITSPETWWIGYIKKGHHSNYEKLKELCGDNIPPAVADLYHPVWQLRFALGIRLGNILNEARFQWSFFWFKKTGKYETTKVNYLN